MADIVIVGVLLLLMGAAVAYIVKAKKNGAKCIGCPAGGNCPGRKKGRGECGCGCQGDEDL